VHVGVGEVVRMLPAAVVDQHWINQRKAGLGFIPRSRHRGARLLDAGDVSITAPPRGRMPRYQAR
jgi:hypothetical protein